jgi:hypothetical protein
LQFDDFWSQSIDSIKRELEKNKAEPGEKLLISNWRPDKGFIDEKFPIREASADKITCLTIHAGKPIEIPRDEMAVLFDLWEDFLSGHTARIEVVEKVPRTTYAISLMKYLKDNVK